MASIRVPTLSVLLLTVGALCACSPDPPGDVRDTPFLAVVKPRPHEEAPLPGPNGVRTPGRSWPAPASNCLGCPAGAQCPEPTMDVDLDLGLPPMDTIVGQTVSPADFPGTDFQKVQLAVQTAQQVSATVVLDRVYELDHTVNINAALTITGGGLRRACSPRAVVTAAALATDNCVDVDDANGFSTGDFIWVGAGPGWADHIVNVGVSSSTPTEICGNTAFGVAIPVGAQLVRATTLLKVIGYTDNVVIDAVLLDGANRCNGDMHDWRYNNAVVFRGLNTIRNSVIHDSPSESLTTCGATLFGNRAFNLQGSFIHKSCLQAPEPETVLANNYVDGSNLASDDVLQHSEGLITLSNNAGTITSIGNVYRRGSEGVFGYAQEEDKGIAATNDCYESFSHIITLAPGVSQQGFSFDAELFGVPQVFR